MEFNNIAGGKFQSFYVNRQSLKDNLNSSAAYDNKKATKQKRNYKGAVIAASLAGAVLPVLAINITKGKGKNALSALSNKSLPAKDKAKSLFSLAEIDGYFGMLASTAGAIGAGAATGAMYDYENKKAKCKEGVFEFLNNMIPTTLVAIGENCIHHFEKKSPKNAQKYNLLRTGMIIGSVASGMFIANKTSCKINEKCFDKKKTESRKFKFCDTFVHLDDLIGLFVISKNPCLKAISKNAGLDKILPLLYARSACEAGMAKDKKIEKSDKKVDFIL